MYIYTHIGIGWFICIVLWIHELIELFVYVACVSLCMCWFMCVCLFVVRVQLVALCAMLIMTIVLIIITKKKHNNI